MVRLLGIIKVLAILGWDYYLLFIIFGDGVIAAVVTSAIALYVWLGGYLSLFKEGAVRSDRLTAYDRDRLNESRGQLIADVKHTSSVNLSGLKIYLIPGDDDMQATAYGANCVSISRGLFENACSVTLNAVLAHEASHIISFDPEFNRAFFCSVTLLIAALSLMSAASVVIVFLIFILLGSFSSWMGFFLFRGSTKVVRGAFGVVQKLIVVSYRSVIGLISRRAEYRSDRYACTLGYGLQLAHFLEAAGREAPRQLTLTEVLYRSHPPTQLRVARLQEQINNEKRNTYGNTVN